MNEQTTVDGPVDETVHRLISQTRSYRRFEESRPISLATLHHLVDLARLSGSARNCQPWQYMVVNEAELCEKIFPHLGWAGYLHDWQGPQPGERPAAYILCLLNQNRGNLPLKHAYFDLGIASQSMLVGAAALTIMGCRIGAISPRLPKLFIVPEHLSLELVIALGHPLEQVQLEEIRANDNVAYWRDEQQIHHVPKYALQDVLCHLEQR